MVCVLFYLLIFDGREIFELDNYSPIPVENEAEYKHVVSRFPFHDAEIEKVCSSVSDANDKRVLASEKDDAFVTLMLVLYYIATISEEAAHVPVSASDLHSGQGVHLCQFKVLRVTASQVSAIHVFGIREIKHFVYLTLLKESTKPNNAKSHGYSVTFISVVIFQLQ